MKFIRLFDVFRHDMRSQFSKPILALTFIAVAIMPILYSGFLIKGNWDPYGQLEDLPVAVVNLDRGAEYDGEIVNIGESFVEELRRDSEFNWQFVDQEAAARGMAANEYYAMITVPEDFSERAVSVRTDNPQQAELIYEANGYSNFIAAQISQNATRELRSELSANITEAYTRIIVENFTKVSEGLQEASDGAGKLQDGAAEIADGIDTVHTNLITAASGARDLLDGAEQLQTGAGSLADAVLALSSGASSLAEGVGQLADAADSLEVGAGKLVQGASDLASGVDSAAAGASSLAANMQQLSSGADGLMQGIASAASVTGQLADGSAQLASQLEQLLKSDASLQSNASLQALLKASQTLADNAAQLNKAQQQLKASSEQLAGGQAQALEGARQLSSGLGALQQSLTAFKQGQGDLYSGIQQMNSKLPELVDGANQLAQGSQQLNDGAQTLQTNLAKLIEGTRDMHDGLTELTSGAASLSDGAGELTDGAAELGGKLADAAKQTASLHGDDQIIHLLAQPVAIEEIDERQVSNYGSGIAPYFLSLAFFAGALIYSNTFPIRHSYDPNARGLKLFISKFLSYTLMGVLMALIVSTIAIYVLKLAVQSAPMFYLYTAIVSLTFMFLVQMLTTWLERPGQFIALVLLILQLVSSAGTFPYELLPDWAQALHPWMPMSYSVVGYRDVISVGSYEDMWTQAGKLLGILAVSILLIGVFYWHRNNRKPEEGHGQAPASAPQQ